MGRIRTIKPEIARHEGLFEAERATGLPLRFAWAVLPTACDKEGRFKWRPRAMKADVLPYDDLDFGAVLEAFVSRGFITKYRIGDEWYGCIPTFRKHQHVNPRETGSDLPDPSEAQEVITRDSRVAHASADGREGKGRELEGNGKDGTSPEALTRSGHAAAPSTSIMEFPVIGTDGTAWVLSEAQVAEWALLFPGVDIVAESRLSLAWLHANPGRRKTSRGMPKFLLGWLTRSVDGGRARMLPKTTADVYIHRPSGCVHEPPCISVWEHRDRLKEIAH